jgi:release factor glutamine methyltransferase
VTAIPRALGRATEELSKTSDTPRLDAELLMAAALGIGRDRLILDSPKGQAPDAFFGFIERRAQGEPVAYITGQRAFWTVDLEVGPGALVPRPDSETLIGAAVEHCGCQLSGPRPGTGPVRYRWRLDEWPKATGLASTRRGRAGLCPPQCRSAGWPTGQNFASAIGPRPTTVRPDPVQPTLRARRGGDGPAIEFTSEALFAARKASTNTSPRSSGRQPAGCRPAAVEIGFDQAESVALCFANRLKPAALDLTPRALLIRG